MSKKEQAQLFWNYMSLDEKQIRIEVGVSDLLAHLNSSENKLANEVTSESLSFAKANGTWKFWSCCHCSEKFVDSELHFHHVQCAHLRRLSPKHCSVLPIRISSDWESMILNGTWKPIDTSAALTILEEQMELLRFRRNEAFNFVNSKVETKSATTDDSHLPESPTNECEVRSVGQLLETDEYSRKKRAREYFLTQSWPFADDLERATMLITVRSLLEALVLNKSLTELHANKVISYSMNELHRFFPTLHIWQLCLDQTHMCICFLGASQLRMIVSFLQEISKFVVKPSCDEENNFDNILSTSTLEFANRDRIVLDGDSLFIFLDERSLGGETNFKKNGNGVHKDRGPLHDALLRWSFTGPSSEEQLESWARLGKERKDNGKRLLQTLAKNLDILKNMLGRKCEQLIYNEALDTIWGYYFDELIERSYRTIGNPQSFETILQNLEKIHEPCVQFERGRNPCFLENRGICRSGYILKAVSDVLEEAQSVTHKETLIGSTGGVSDWEMFEKRFSEVQIHSDSYIGEGVKRAIENNDLELIKSDAWIMPTLTETQNLELKITPFAAADYQAILLPLVKSYIQTHMVRLEDIDATNKSETAKEATLTQSTFAKNDLQFQPESCWLSFL